MDIITSFLHGMYYAGQRPSRAEYRDIAKYLRSSRFVRGTQLDVEKQVQEAIAEMHKAMFPDEEKQEGQS